MGVGLFVAFGAIAIAVAVFGYIADQKRRDVLMQFARSKGWLFEPENDALTVFAQGAPFGEGDHRRARNVLHGTVDGRDMVAFDYSYQTHSTDGKGHRTTTTHHFAVVGLRLPVYFPALQVTGESVFHRAAQLLGFDDIELESDEFNRRFHVSAPDRKFACDVLTPRTMQALLAGPDVDWRIEGPLMLSWRSGKQDPVQLLAQLSTLGTVLAGVPSFVWKDFGTDTDQGVDIPSAPNTERPAS